MLKSRFATFALTALSIACNKEHPKPGAKPQGSEALGNQAQEKTPPSGTSQPQVRVAANGSPLFDHFVGEACALSRMGETWCPANSESTVYFRLPISKPIKSVYRTRSPLFYLLAEDGQLYLMGQFDSDIDPKWSLDYSTPHPVAGLSDLVQIASGYQVFGLRKNGELLSWTMEEVRDEDALAVRVDQTPPRLALDDPVEQVFGAGNLCLETRAKFWCTAETSNLRKSYRFSPPGLEEKPPALADVSGSACFGTGSKKLHCYAGWTPIGLGNQRLIGHFEINVQAKKVRASAGLVLDAEGRLFDFGRPNLLSNSPEELKSPVLVHLKHLGEVADFEGNFCIISTAGVLSCDTQGNWSKETPAPVTFTLTPPPKVKGPGD
jgi:hypothetical protein